MNTFFMHSVAAFAILMTLMFGVLLIGMLVMQPIWTLVGLGIGIWYIRYTAVYYIRRHRQRETARRAAEDARWAAMPTALD